MLSRLLTAQQFRAADWRDDERLPLTAQKLLLRYRYTVGWLNLAVRLALEELGEDLPDARWVLFPATSTRWSPWWLAPCPVEPLPSLVRVTVRNWSCTATEGEPVADGFHVVPTDMIISSGGFTDLQNWASTIHRDLIGSMDAAAGMAGDDDAGHAFAAKYDPAAQAVVTAVGKVVAQLGGTANGLFTMAMNYIKTDSDVAADLMQPQQLPQTSGPQCDDQPLNVQIPSAVGHNDSAVEEIIAQFWPQGDGGKLRQAAADWKQIADLMSRIGTEGDGRVQRVTASSTAQAVTSFAANWAKMHDGCATQGPLLNSITNAAYKLGTACESYAQAVDDLRTKLEELAGGAAIVAGVGIGLTIFTLGISDAAAAGGEAAIAAEASTAALAMSAELEGSAELAVLAEAEAVVNEAAASLIPVGTAGATALAATSLALTSATPAMAAKPKVPNTVTPGLPPLPPAADNPFPDLTPAQQAQVQAWMAQAEADPSRSAIADDPLNATTPEMAARRAYQIKVAGSTERSLYTTLDNPRRPGTEATMNADGIRPQDGAAVDSKYINPTPKKGCGSPFRLNNADNVFHYTYENSLADQTWEAQKYASAFKDPRNQPINRLEVITNDEKGADYFRAIMAAENCPGYVRIEP